MHQRLLATSGGSAGLRDLGRLEAALAQPWVTFDGNELYPGVVEKAATLGFSLIQGHPFIDGNKRVGHAAMEVFLILNGHSLNAPVDEQERVILDVAAGAMDRAAFTEWVRSRV